MWFFLHDITLRALSLFLSNIKQQGLEIESNFFICVMTCEDSINQCTYKSFSHQKIHTKVMHAMQRSKGAPYACPCPSLPSISWICPRVHSISSIMITWVMWYGIQWLARIVCQCSDARHNPNNQIKILLYARIRQLRFRENREPRAHGRRIRAKNSCQPGIVTTW